MTAQKKLRVSELLVKRPFARILPTGQYEHGYAAGDTPVPVPHDSLRRKIVTQEDFLRELDPSGHIINNREAFPDIWRQNEEDGRWYVQEIPRYAFAFQQIILTKHLTHLCGNDIQFELSDTKVSGEARETYNRFRQGWATKNMEVAWYHFVKSVKATGDGAIIGYLDHGVFGYRVLSFLQGDRLYPHYDMRTGRLLYFARTYNSYDEVGGVSRRMVDLWDDRFYYRFSQEGDPTFIAKVGRALKSLFTDDEGWDTEFIGEHGFDKIPVAYHRDDYGPCWTFSEEAIENYEIAFSNLAHSNHDFGLPIMYVKGNGSAEVTNADMSYASKIMLLPSDGDIGFLNRQDASNAYMAELNKLEESIYKQSNAVKTPELKAGDTPGVTLKIMYSDAYEKAMCDAHEYDDALDKVVEIFKWGYGIESESRLKFLNTAIHHYIEPYIHLNTAELTQNLSTAVFAGFLSRQTASEKFPLATPQEWERILREKHDEDMHRLLVEEQSIEIENTAEIADEDNTTDTEADDTNKTDDSTD